ncbi:MAG: hydroxychlorobactene glucosyltransferase CruC [Chloroflexota bacterium]
MGHRNSMNVWVLLALQCLVGRLSQRHFQSLPQLQEPAWLEGGHVSIVIPARNEGHQLPNLLRSLAGLRYPTYDVVVVDDDSEDDTAEVAGRFGARVLHSTGPEAGWTGKNFACWMGAQETRGDWLLFTDADTVHGPDSLARALGTARARSAGLVSLLARQHCLTFWERLLLPYVYSLYFVGAGHINQRGRNPVANGQYMLFNRRDYERIGGHSSVRGSVIDDVALARTATEHSVHVVLLRAESNLEVRMYDSLSALWEGFSKNAFRFIAISPRFGLPSALAGIVYGATLPTVLRSRSRSIGLAAVLAPAVGLLRWERTFGVPYYYALFYPLAALVFQLIALDSMRRSLFTGGTVWKGRTY